MLHLEYANEALVANDLINDTSNHGTSDSSFEKNMTGKLDSTHCAINSHLGSGYRTEISFVTNPNIQSYPGKGHSSPTAAPDYPLSQNSDRGADGEKNHLINKTNLVTPKPFEREKDECANFHVRFTINKASSCECEQQHNNANFDNRETIGEPTTGRSQTHLHFEPIVKKNSSDSQPLVYRYFHYPQTKQKLSDNCNSAFEPLRPKYKSSLIVNLNSNTNNTTLTSPYLNEELFKESDSEDLDNRDQIHEELEIDCSEERIESLDELSLSDKLKQVDSNKLFESEVLSQQSDTESSENSALTMNPTSCSIMSFIRNRSGPNSPITKGASSTSSSEPDLALIKPGCDNRDRHDTSDVFNGERPYKNESLTQLTVDCNPSDQLSDMKPIASSTYISPDASTFMTHSILKNQLPISQHSKFINDRVNNPDNTGSRDTENIKEKQRQAIRELEELVEKKRAEISQMRRKLDEKERLKFSQSRSLAEKIIIKRNEKIALSIDCHLLEMELDQRDAPPSSTDYDGSTGSRSRLGSKINPGEENTAQILDAIPACADHQLSRYNEAVRRQSHQGIIGSSNTATSAHSRLSQDLGRGTGGVSGSPGSQRKHSYIPMPPLPIAIYPMPSSNLNQQTPGPPYPKEDSTNIQQPTRPDHFVGGLKPTTNLANRKF